MIKRVKELLSEAGQDLIEYSLLIAFVALASAALFINTGGSVKGIWSTTESQLAHAAPCNDLSSNPCND
jgi:Flp pilus assembly pilin Flp